MILLSQVPDRNQPCSDCGDPALLHLTSGPANGPYGFLECLRPGCGCTSYTVDGLDADNQSSAGND